MSNKDFNEEDYLLANPDVAAAVKQGRIISGHVHYTRYGEKEGRRMVKDNNELSREKKALFLLDKHGAGLEIGPSHNPIAPKKEGYNVHILDYMTAEELRNKYKDHVVHGVDIERIEEVDFVWKGEPYYELIGKIECYDWIIASHAIEHMPDMVSFLQQCEKLLKPSGVLSLVIPDKRYCFDFFSPSSTSGAILDAYANNSKRPSPGQVFDYIANSVKRNGNIAWSADNDFGECELLHTFAHAQNLWGRSVAAEDYIDAHCWKFTPASFRLIISDLVNLNLCSLMIQREFDTTGCEFIVQLVKNTSSSNSLDRLTALQHIKDNHIKDINTELYDMTLRLDSLSETLRDKKIIIDSLGQRVSGLQSDLHSMRLSSSWRFTAPLRRIKNIFCQLLK